MKYINIVSFYVLITICICCSYAIAESIDIKQGDKIVVELDFIPRDIKPGDKPITLNKDLIARLFPELTMPRLMNFEDLQITDEKEAFIEGGYSFVLRGDFNGDGFADIIFVGKHDQPISTNNCFVAMVTIGEKKVTRNFFLKIHKDHVSLLKVINYKPKIDAIGMSYNLASDDCGYLYWNNEKWQYDECKSAW